MSETVYLNIVVEDVLSEVLLRKVIDSTGKDLKVLYCYRKGGSGYIRKNIERFNQAARVRPFLVLVDLDQIDCPPTLIGKWIGFRVNDNFLFRVAVREIESWIMADSVSFAGFISVPVEKVPRNIEELANPKEFLLNLAKSSNNREIRNDLLPPQGSASKYGPLYNDLLSTYIRNHWQPYEAARKSPSLKKLINRLEAL